MKFNHLIALIYLFFITSLSSSAFSLEAVRLIQQVTDNFSYSIGFDDWQSVIQRLYDDWDQTEEMIVEWGRQLAERDVLAETSRDEIQLVDVHLLRAELCRIETKTIGYFPWESIGVMPPGYPPLLR